MASLERGVAGGHLNMIFLFSKLGLMQFYFIERFWTTVGIFSLGDIDVIITRYAAAACRIRELLEELILTVERLGLMDRMAQDCSR